MAQDSDDVADAGDGQPISEVEPPKSDSKASTPGYFEQLSSKKWSSVPSSGGSAGPQLLGVGVIVAIVMIIVRRRNASNKALHEKSLA